MHISTLNHDLKTILLGEILKKENCLLYLSLKRGNMKKRIISIFLVVTLIIIIGFLSFIRAGTPHGVIGFINNSTDGVDANGADVNFSIFRTGLGYYCVLTDVVGES